MVARLTVLSILITLFFCHALLVQSHDDDQMNVPQFHPEDDYEGPGSNGYSDSYGYHGIDGEADESDRPHSAKELQSWNEIESFIKVN